MKVICEISKPHYHPGPGFKMKVTKKRDLSQKGQWVANERIEKNGKSYAIVMPPRSKELWEERQEPHLHADPETAQNLGVKDGDILNPKNCPFSIKIKIAENFVPRIHLDHVDAEKYNIKNGDIIEF